MYILSKSLLIIFIFEGCVLHVDIRSLFVLINLTRYELYNFQIKNFRFSLFISDIYIIHTATLYISCIYLFRWKCSFIWLSLTLIISRTVYFCTKKHYHVNIFHNNSTAIVSSLLFLTHALLVILKLNLCI